MGLGAFRKKEPVDGMLEHAQGLMEGSDAEPIPVQKAPLGVCEHPFGWLKTRVIGFTCWDGKRARGARSCNRWTGEG